MNQSDRQFLITYNSFFILNEMSISREVKIEELRAITILTKDEETWPQLDANKVESLDLLMPEDIDSRMLIHVNHRYDSLVMSKHRT